LTAHDTELIRRIGRGDESALEALMLAYAEWLVNVAAPIVASEDLAQDVVQDVFVRLWEIRTQLQIQGSVAGYLYRAVCNRARDVSVHERSQQTLGMRAQQALGALDSQPVSADAMSLGDPEFARVLDTALGTLQPRVRDIFLMRVQGDMSYAEIAEALGIGIPTVRVQMSKATTALTRLMTTWLNSNPERGDSR